jgi:hypothetical protein
LSTQPLKLLGKSICKPGNRRTLVTSEGRKLAPPDLDAEKVRWEKAIKNVKRNVPQKAHFIGEFHSVSDLGDFAYAITLNKPFFQDRSSETQCILGRGEETEKLVKTLEAGVALAVWIELGVGKDAKKPGIVKEISRFDDPDNKVIGPKVERMFVPDSQAR